MSARAKMSLGVICVIAMAVSFAIAGPSDRCIETQLLSTISSLPVGTLAHQDNVIVPKVRGWIQDHSLFDSSGNVKCEQELAGASCCIGKEGTYIPFGAVVDWIMEDSRYEIC